MGIRSFLTRGHRLDAAYEANLAIGRAALDREAAKERLKKVEKKTTEACTIAEQLRVARENNHFAERMKTAMSDSRGKDKK